MPTKPKVISDALLDAVTPTVLKAESENRATKAIEKYLEINGMTMAEYKRAIALRSQREDAKQFWSNAASMAGNVAESLASGLTLGFSNYLQAGIDMATSPEDISYSQALKGTRDRRDKFWDENATLAMTTEGVGSMYPGKFIAQAATHLPGLAMKTGQVIKNRLRELLISTGTTAGESAIIAGNEGRDPAQAAKYGAMWGTATVPGAWGVQVIAKYGMRNWRRLLEKYGGNINVDHDLAMEEAAKIHKDNLRRDQQTPETQEEALQKAEVLGTAEDTMLLDLQGPKQQGTFKAASIQGDTTPVVAKTLDERQKTIRERVTNYFGDLLGVRNTESMDKRINELMKEAKDKAQPDYVKTYSAPRIKNGSQPDLSATDVAPNEPSRRMVHIGEDSIIDEGGRLAEKMRTILSALEDWGKGKGTSFWGRAKAQAKLELEDFSPEVKAAAKMDDVLNPDDVSFATVDAFKKHLDEIIRTEHPKSHFYALLNRRKNELVEIADELLLRHETKIYNQQKATREAAGIKQTLTPEGQSLDPPPPEMSSYQKARNKYSSAYRMKKAVEDGKTFLDDKVNAKDIIYELGQLEMTPTEMMLFRTSAFNKGAHTLSTKISNPKGAAEQWLDPNTEEKLRWAIPHPDNYAKFGERMETLSEQAFNNNFFNVKSGSQTAPIQEALNPKNEAIQVLDAANRGNYPGLVDKLSADSPAQTAYTQDLLGTASLSKGPEQIRETQKRFGPDQDKYLSDKFKSPAGLLGRRGGFGAGGLSLLSPREEFQEPLQ